jgi:hypothetical protein
MKKLVHAGNTRPKIVNSVKRSKKASGKAWPQGMHESRVPGGPYKDKCRC